MDISVIRIPTIINESQISIPTPDEVMLHCAVASFPSARVIIVDCGDGLGSTGPLMKSMILSYLYELVSLFADQYSNDLCIPLIFTSHHIDQLSAEIHVRDSLEPGGSILRDLLSLVGTYTSSCISTVHKIDVSRNCEWLPPVELPCTIPSFRGRSLFSGTFDRLHAGHMFLLNVMHHSHDSSQESIVSITTDAMLQSKSNRQLIESFDKRRRRVLSFMKLCSYSNAMGSEPRITLLPLSDPCGIALTAEVVQQDVLIVTPDTARGGEFVNRERLKLNLAEISLWEVPEVGRQGASKLSSSQIRSREASLRD
eukprot:GHVH01010953.1.p1 GENE.GHVH01010953.1~~GHVH01010953.1.p1  ORF type:complete len:312 (+),score=24.72 GHVH01010953.1:57-992(+)